MSINFAVMIFHMTILGRHKTKGKQGEKNNEEGTGRGNREGEGRRSVGLLRIISSNDLFK